MHDLVCDVIDYCVCNCETGKMSVYDEIINEVEKKEKMVIKEIGTRMKNGLG